MPRAFQGALLTVCLLTAQTSLAVTKNGFDLDDALIPADKIEQGGPPRDGIPAIDNPKFLAAAEAEFLRDRHRVLGVYRNGIAKRSDPKFCSNQLSFSKKRGS